MLALSGDIIVEIDVNVLGNVQFLVPESILDVFIGRSLAIQHCGVRVPQGMKVKIFVARLMYDFRCVLHRSRIYELAVVSNTDKLYFSPAASRIQDVEIVFKVARVETAISLVHAYLFFTLGFQQSE